MPNHYYTSDGQRITQSTINRRRSDTYRNLYSGSFQVCSGCGKPAQGTAHCVPQMVCKQEGIAEYCFIAYNMFPACHHCNAVAENFRSPEFLKLHNVKTIVEVTARICPSRYAKMCEVGVTIERFNPLKQYEEI